MCPYIPSVKETCSTMHSEASSHSNKPSYMRFSDVNLKNYKDKLKTKIIKNGGTSMCEDPFNYYDSCRFVERFDDIFDHFGKALVRNN